MERDFSNDWDEYNRLFPNGGAPGGVTVPDSEPWYPSPGPTPQPGAPTGAPPPPPATGGGKTPAQIEAEGRAFDAAHGYVGGYMMDGVWVNGSPTSSSGGGGGSDWGGGAGSGQFDYGPRPQYAGYSAYGPFSPSMPAFSYEAFTPTNAEGLWDESQNPGFAKSQERLRKQVEAGAAYRGMLRSGMTIGDLDSVLGSNLSQNFQQFDARRFRNWQGNRENAFGAWASKYGMEKDMYSFGAEENARKNNYTFNVDDAKGRDALARWETLIGQLGNLSKPV